MGKRASSSRGLAALATSRPAARSYPGASKFVFAPRGAHVTGCHPAVRPLAKACGALSKEVFADAAAAFARGDWRPASMLAWLYAIAQRRFADEARRRRQSYNRVPLDDLLEEVPTADGPGLARALREANSRLSPSQQQVICMKVRSRP